MTITDRCEHCGAKFQIDDTAISECKKKNKWECHCPGCNKYIDMKKYEFMFAYEFPGAENKNTNNIVNYAFNRNYPNIYKNAYLFFKKIGLFGLIIGIPATAIFLVLLVLIMNFSMDCDVFDVFNAISIILGIIGMIGLGIALPCLFFAYVFYHAYWKYENFVRLVEKR